MSAQYQAKISVRLGSWNWVTWYNNQNGLDQWYIFPARDTVCYGSQVHNNNNKPAEQQNNCHEEGALYGRHVGTERVCVTLERLSHLPHGPRRSRCTLEESGRRCGDGGTELYVRTESVGLFSFAPVWEYNTPRIKSLVWIQRCWWRHLNNELMGERNVTLLLDGNCTNRREITKYRFKSALNTTVGFQTPVQ